ncbi:MAG: hypothetical protein ACOYLD_16230 [Anaerohalosphaeraceae bacterium]|jgi:serine protease AprX
MTGAKKQYPVFWFLVVAFCTLAATPQNAPAAEIRDLIARVDVYSTTADEVFALLGEPLQYIWGNQTFTRDSLPEVYIMKYPENINILIVRGEVDEIRFEAGPPWYVFGRGIRIGSSLEDVFEELGPPGIVLDKQPPGMRDRVFYRDWVPGAAYYCFADRDVRIFFWNGEVSGIYLFRGGQDGIKPRQVRDFDDIRHLDLRNTDLSEKIAKIATLSFNARTQWPAPDKLPEDFDPQAWIDAAMNPGLEIRTLHEQGITGKGVAIGVIAAPLNTAHPEFAGRIAWHLDLAATPDFRRPGTAIAGLLAGANCGIAPQADLYYCAVRIGASETDYVEALARLMELNKSLAADRKIRLVCVPVAPDGGLHQSGPGQETWQDACIAAEQAGMLIIDGAHRHGFIRQCSYDASAPDDITRCIPGAPDKTPIASPNNLYAPTSPRTVPESIGNHHDYAFCGRGDSAWSIPYCAGVLALGWQVNPALTPEEIMTLLYETAYVTPDNARIIYPLMFITEIARAKQKGQ